MAPANSVGMSNLAPTEVKREDSSISKRQLNSLELFAGAGGLALGVHGAGFQLLEVIERDKRAVETLRTNSRRVFGLDPAKIASQDAREFPYKKYAGQVDLMAGGPPCQPFSNSGSNRGELDPRDGFPIFLDAIGDVLPRAVLIENVRGLLRTRFADYVHYIEQRMRLPLLRAQAGEGWRKHYDRLCSVSDMDVPARQRYVVKHFLVDAADYGVPQRRERVFFVAFRADLGVASFDVPPTHSKEALLHAQFVTGDYWRKHKMEPRTAHLGESLKRRLRIMAEKPLAAGLKPWVTVRDAIRDLPPPVPRGAPEEILNHTQHPGARIYAGHIGSFLDLPAKALKAGTHGTPGGENMLRDDANGKRMRPRYFSTREAARLQTFPDTWNLKGAWGACIKQMGNAVPVALARTFALKIHQRLSEVDRRS